MQRNSTPSTHTGYTSVKAFSWNIQSLISQFIKKDKTIIAKRMSEDGMRTSQIARILYGKATTNNMAKVTRLLKEVK